MGPGGAGNIYRVLGILEKSSLMRAQGRRGRHAALSNERAELASLACRDGEKAPFEIGAGLQRRRREKEKPELSRAAASFEWAT